MPRRGLKIPWRSLFLGADGVVAAEAMVELVLVDGVGAPGRQRLMRKLPADLEAAVAILVAGSA